MMKRKGIFGTVLITAALVMMLWLILVRSDAASPTADVSVESEDAPEGEEAAPQPSQSRALSKRKPGHAKPLAQAAPTSDGNESVPQQPECRRDEDCRGPHTADCVETKCLKGKCMYDKAHCECRTSADCDDGDPCTRNHCFVPTMSCIYIPEGCDSNKK